jgi:regulator of protease activity HflC (stomatin/prohibitin superfamily)
MKIALMVTAVIGGILGGMWALNRVLEMLSSKDGILFASGIAGSFAIVFASVYLGSHLWMLLRPWCVTKKDSHVPVLIFIFLCGVLAGCTNIPPGHVGIKVNNWGSAKGVEDFPLVTGVVLYNPITSTVFDWPTSVQTAIWTHSPTKGKKHNEEISYNSAEGLAFTADISLSYRLKPERVPHFYVQFRSDNMDSFTHGFLRNVARDAFNEVAAHFNADELYGTKKEEVLIKSRDRINAIVGDIGVIIEQFGYVGAPRPPQNVVDAINMKIKATQDAIRTENEVRSAKAEAQKSVAKAQGEAQSIIA